MMNQFLRRVKWDIETGAEPLDVLRKFYEPMAPFSETACKAKYATARKPGMVGTDFIAAKKAEHEAEVVTQWEEFVSKAALSPVTGRIVAIGLRENGVNRILTARTPAEEKAIIAEFLALAVDVLANGGIMEGFNTDAFDNTFVFRRALKYRLNPHVLRRGRFWHDGLRDLLAIWRAGDRTEFISLDDISEFLGTEHRKNGDGAFFADTFAKDPATAIAYLGNDLLMTEEVGLVLVPDAASAAAAGSAASDDVPFAAERAA
jgi:hypothetical protein